MFLTFSSLVSVGLIVVVERKLCYFPNSLFDHRYLKLIKCMKKMKFFFQGAENADPSWIRVFLLDMQLSESGVVVLMAAINPNISQQLHYALGRLHFMPDYN